MKISGEAVRGPSWSAGVVLLAAGAVALILGWLAIHDPIYGTDAGYRVYFGERPVLKLGNRMWLPFLQVHIWLYHLLGLPVAGLKLITVFYYALGLSCLGLYWRQILGSDTKASLWGVLAVLCFAGQGLPQQTSELMQEQVGFGLFFLFVWLASRDRPLPLAALAAGFGAMLARDSYWFYLLAFMLADLRNLPWGKRRAGFYVGLWAAPAAWMCVCIPLIYVVAYGRLPQIPLEWPLMYNPTGKNPSTAETWESIRSALVESRVIFVAAGVAFSALVVAAWRRSRFFAQFDGSPFTSTVVRAAPIALAVVYGLILVIDPWQETPGNWRQGWPLLEVSFVVAPLLIRAALAGPLLIRHGVAVTIVAGMLAGIQPNTRHRPASAIAADAAELAKLRPLLDSADGKGPLSVCMAAKSRWEVFRYLSGPTFYLRKTYLRPKEPVPGHCRLLIVEDGAAAVAGGGFVLPEGYVEVERVSTARFHWTVFERRAESPGVAR